MKIKQLLVSVALLCTIATDVGCVSVDRRMSQNSFDATNLIHNGGQFSAEFSQSVSEKWFAGSTGDPQVNLNQLAFQKPDLDTNRAVTSDEWQRFDASAGPKEYFSALDVNGDGQNNATEFLTQTPKHAKRYHFFADPEKTNKDYSSRDQEEFQPPGLLLFSIRF